MANKDDYADLPTLTAHLAGKLNSQRIAIILGAGVSTPFGLPKWDELIARLYNSRGISPPTSGDLTQQAEDFRIKFFKGNDRGFKEAVKAALYQNFDVGIKEMRNHLGLAAIGSLVMASKRGSASQIVSFNYDNVLEIYLAYHGFLIHSVPEPVHWFRDADVTIYHPHGFLPYGPSEPSSNLTLDRESYDRILGKDLPWRQLMLTLMRTRLCIFIGLSADDVALTQLLSDVKELHAVSGTQELFWGVCFTTNPDLKSRWETRRVFCHVLNSYDELPDILFSICQTAAKLRGWD